jgi:hypothetical protein
VDTRPDALAVYLKRYAHLFIEDGQEGEIIPTFHIGKTTDLDYASDPIPIPHHHASQSSTRSGRATTTHTEILSQATVEPTEPPTEVYQPQNPTHRGNTDDALDQHDWWDDADVSGLIDLEAFNHFLYSCD